MGDDRQELEALVAVAYRQSPFSFDLVVSAFLQALHSHRRPSVCTPFPTSLFTTRHGEKDFDAAEAAVQEVSKLQLDACMTRLRSLAESAEHVNPFAKLPLESLKLMQWLLRFQYEVHLVGDPTLELPKEIYGKFFESRRSTAALSGLLPDYILKLEESGIRPCTAFEDSRSQFGSIFAFHGTPAENLHSILRCGTPLYLLPWLFL